jgi:hypothetical protein
MSEHHRMPAAFPYAGSLQSAGSYLWNRRMPAGSVVLVLK